LFVPLLGEIGYWLRTDATGQGYVTEAGRAMVDFSFDTLSLERLELVAGVENHASNRVAEKLGFRREGLMRSAGFTLERRYDCYIYGLLPSDPRPSGLAQHQPDQLLDQVDQEQADPDH
jgi:ribosomal-protein-serine acetyltransferase